MTTDDQDKAIQALMTKQGYVTARVKVYKPGRAVSAFFADHNGNEHYHTIGPEGWVPFHGYPAHENIA
jgi:hypothetical protein